MAKRPLSIKKLNAILDSPGVREQLRMKAARILPKARAVANSTGARNFAAALEVEEGTRPGAGSPEGFRRPYARVRADITDQVRKDGRTPLTRQKILRRASNA